MTACRERAAGSLRVDVGSALQARFVREGSGDAAHVVRGAIRLADPAATTAAESPEPLVLPAAGVTAVIALKKVNIDEWEAAADRLFAEPARGTAAAPVYDASGGPGYVPDRIGLRLGELTTGSRRLGNVTAGLSRDGGLWRANVDSDELDGYIEYRPARRGAAPAGPGAGRVYARLSRLNLPKGEAERVESLLDEQPASVPRSTSWSTISSFAASASVGSRSRRRTAPPAGTMRCANGGSRSSTWSCRKRSSRRPAPGERGRFRACAGRAGQRWTSR